MQETNNKIVEAIDSIDKVTDLFYQQKQNEAYNKMQETFNLLSLITSGFTNNQEIEFNSKLMEAMKALEEKDTVLFADILKYDITKMLQEIISV